MATGTVKWFNDSKGFSITPDGGGEDLFAHFSEINMQGFKTLGRTESFFEIVDGKRQAGGQDPGRLAQSSFFEKPGA